MDSMEMRSNYGTQIHNIPDPQTNYGPKVTPDTSPSVVTDPWARGGGGAEGGGVSTSLVLLAHFFVGNVVQVT